jgi:hypothetical protein
MISYEFDDSWHLLHAELRFNSSGDLHEQVPRKERHRDHLLSIAPFALLIEQRKKMHNSEASQRHGSDLLVA